MNMNKKELNEQEMDQVVGGSLVKNQTYTVNVSDGYLALRNDRCYDYSNERGQLYNGSVVRFIGDAQDSDYVYVVVDKQVNGQWTSKNIVGEVGYVNKNYLR